MLKKIILAIVAVLITGGVITLYGTYKIADIAIDESLKEMEPQLRQYVQMNETAQNEYILKNANEIIAERIASSKAKGKPDLALLEKSKDNPAAQKALINLGRTLMAKAIVHSETITKEMSADIKAKYQRESDNFTIALKNYGDILETLEKSNAA